MTQPKVPALFPLERRSVRLERDKVTGTSLGPWLALPRKGLLGCVVAGVWEKLVCEAVSGEVEVGYQEKVLFAERGGDLGTFPRE